MREVITLYVSSIYLVGAAEKAALKNGGVRVNLGGRPRTDLDLLLEAFFFRLRNAGPWRDLPTCYGPWSTVHCWHSRWAREGLWEKLLCAFARKSHGMVRLVDGTHVRVHQCATNPVGGAAAQAMGKTRGGRNTKVMALTTKNGFAVRLALIEGQAYEGHHVVKLLDSSYKTIVVGDKGFDDDKLRQELRNLGHEPCFPSRGNRKHKSAYNKALYRQRYKVENYFCRLKRWGCTATRRDKLARNFLSLLNFASVIDWMQPRTN
jgi:transposase